MHTTYDDIKRFLRQVSYLDKHDSHFNFDSATNQIIDLVEDYLKGVGFVRAIKMNKEDIDELLHFLEVTRNNDNEYLAYQGCYTSDSHSTKMTRKMEEIIKAAVREESKG